MQEINLNELYKKWPFVRRDLKLLGCHRTEAEDIFQEALLVLCRKMEDPNFKLEVEPIHFVKSTCKFLWYNQSRKNQKQGIRSLEEYIPEVDKDSELISEEWLEKENKITSIEHAILEIGKQCQEILKLFYGENLSMELIAKKIGLRNEKVAKTQKYRCIQKVKDKIILLKM